MQCFYQALFLYIMGKVAEWLKHIKIEMNLEQLERLLKNLPEGIMLEICFGKEEHGEDT